MRDDLVNNRSIDCVVYWKLKIYRMTFRDRLFSWIQTPGNFLVVTRSIINLEFHDDLGRWFWQKLDVLFALTPVFSQKSMKNMELIVWIKTSTRHLEALPGNNVVVGENLGTIWRKKDKSMKGNQFWHTYVLKNAILLS